MSSARRAPCTSGGHCSTISCPESAKCTQDVCTVCRRCCAAIVTDCLQSGTQRLDQAPQFVGRELVEAFTDFFFGPLQEDPGGLPVPLAGEEVDPAPHGAVGGIGMHLEVDLPAYFAARQLAHVFGLLGPGERG